MKIMTVLGTRPEIIRLSRIIPLLDRLCHHVLVHTGQNHDPGLNGIFFEELGIRQPDHILSCAADTLFGQIALILRECERVVTLENPDRLLILGDTNSALSAIVAKRMGIPVYHMEAGNRCYDDRVPEEVNRRIIDHSSDVLLPYTKQSRENLIREGIEGSRILVTGNPIYEVVNHYNPQIEKSDVLSRLGLTATNYFLVTVHRAENVDVEERFRSLTDALQHLHKKYGQPVIISTHPRARNRMEQYGLKPDSKGLSFHPPFGFFDFMKLQRNARCVLSDSGTVQEECAIFHVPNVTIRDVTERPETLECGSNMLSGAMTETVLDCVRTVLDLGRDWEVPPEYVSTVVSEKLARILLGYRA